MERKLKAFTLVEILIIVMILAILTMLVIPQFGEASNEARASALKTDLHTIRSQIQVYRAQHLNNYPDAANFVTQLTTKTDPDGAAGGDLGPYIQEFPTNPFNNKATVETNAGSPGVGNGSHGWHFDTSTGRFSADDSAEHAAW